MAVQTVTPGLVKMLRGSNPIRRRAGGAGNVGDLVVIDANGNVVQGNGAVAGTAKTLGIVIAAAAQAKTDFVSGDMVDVVTYGLVTGFSGMTPGAILYQSNTAGKVDDAAGTVTQIVGRAASATEIFINPPMTA